MPRGLRRDELEALKASHPLRERCDALGLDLDGSGTGPCPRACCPGRRQFYVHHESWACRTCHLDHGDVIELERWLFGISFAEAVQRLVDRLGGSVPPPTVSAVSRRHEGEERAWRKWVDRNTYFQERCAAALSEELWAEAHRQYLSGRGISLATANHYEVGAYPHRPRGDDREQAIGQAVLVLPHRGGACRPISALKYRLLQPIPIEEDRVLRYTSEPGSRPSLFVPRTYLNADVIVATEGEINAMSLWEALKDSPKPWDFDVISFGSESSTNHLPSVIEGCERLVIWADEAAKARAAAVASGRDDAVVFRSPDGQDANDLLVRYGPDALRDALLASLPAAWATTSPKPRW